MADGVRDGWAMSRRRILELGALGAVAAPLAASTLRAQESLGPGASDPSAARKRAARVAHLTDIHIQPELAAAAGAAKCLQHAQALSDAPELIITGGDVLMDVFEADDARTGLLAKLWRDTLRAECSLPIRAVIGNHDIRPWSTSDAVGGAGKAWAAEFFQLERRYYGFDHGGWRFLVLDTVQPNGAAYTGLIDAEQRAWLESELANLAEGRPAILISHIPILTVTTLIASTENAAEGDHRIPGGWMLRDGASLHYLLRDCPGVKLCLSGHMHLLDRCEVDGVTYICGGAVSANWWKGPRQKVLEGYGVVDLFDDGSFEYAYVPFGWEAATG